MKSKRSYDGWFGVLSKLENQIQFTGNNRIFVRKVTPKEAMINQKKTQGWLRMEKKKLIANGYVEKIEASFSSYANRDHDEVHRGREQP